MFGGMIGYTSDGETLATFYMPVMSFGCSNETCRVL